LLAKWLPVFFVPSLVTLPQSLLANSVSGGNVLPLAELVKVAVVVGGGFFLTLVTTACSVVVVSQGFSRWRRTATTPAVSVVTLEEDEDNNNDNDSNSVEEDDRPTTSTATSESTATPIDKNDSKDHDEEMDEERIESTLSSLSSDAAAGAAADDDDDLEPAGDEKEKLHRAVMEALDQELEKERTIQKRPFSNTLLYSLLSTSVVAGVGSVATYWTGNTVAHPTLTTVCLLTTTLSSFVLGTRLPKRITKVVHPLITCSFLTWTVLATLGLATAQSFGTMLSAYRTGGAGAGDWLLFCLGPAVVSLAVSMYEKRNLMKDNLAEVAAAIGVSTLGGVFGTATLVRLLELGSPTLRLALLSRNITSPLAMVSWATCVSF